MLLDPTKTVRELALEIPNATRVFEKSKIDYCCGGSQPLSEACARAGVEVEEVCRLLTDVGPSVTPSAAASGFQSLPLVELANYIVNKHHLFTRQEVERLTALLEKVCSVHGTNHPELLKIQSGFQSLRAELEPHMFKEERILFPYIVELDGAVIENRPVPRSPFGSVRNPVAVMMEEHDAAGEILRAIRWLSGDFAVPEDACFSYRTLYGALEEFEADLHQHIHLENNILFPRALEAEDQALER